MSTARHETSPSSTRWLTALSGRSCPCCFCHRCHRSLPEVYPNKNCHSISLAKLCSKQVDGTGWRQPFYIIIYHQFSSLLFPQYFIEHPHRINQLRCPTAMAFHAGIFCPSWRLARKSSKPHRSFIQSIPCTHPESLNVVWMILVCA